MGDRGSKTYSEVLGAKPYGRNFQINQNQCIGNVQKRMGTRLRNVVKKTAEEKEIKGKTIRKKRKSFCRLFFKDNLLFQIN